MQCIYKSARRQDVLTGTTPQVRVCVMPTRSSKPHHDANQAAKHILDQLTGDAPKEEPPPAPVKNAAAVALGQLGAAEQALNDFERGDWGQRYPTVTAALRRAWDRVIPFFAFPPEVRRVVYTTNAIESVHSRLRKIIKTRGHFPSDDAASKLIWLALRNITADWSRAAKEWKLAMNQFAILYEERFTQVAHGAGR